MIDEKVMEELLKLDPKKAMELIDEATKRAYPDLELIYEKD